MSFALVDRFLVNDVTSVTETLGQLYSISQALSLRVKEEEYFKSHLSVFVCVQSQKYS